MKRETNRAASAILVADLHLTDTSPISRTDDYQAAQRTSLEFLQSLSRENNDCPILCAGDVFDHWKASPWLCAFAYKYLPRPFVCIPGQHDLPGHSLGQIERAALGLLGRVAEDIHVLQSADEIYEWSPSQTPIEVVGIPYGQIDIKARPDSTKKRVEGTRKIIMLHSLIWEKEIPPWSKEGITAQDVVDAFPEADLILVGDNHQSFVYTRGETILVNPGSMLQMTADQQDYSPRCFLYYAETNKIRPVYLPIEKGAINRDHVDSKRERDSRIAAYIEHMNTRWEIGLSFRKNLEAFFAENQTPKKVREIIWQAMEPTR